MPVIVVLLEESWPEAQPQQLQTEKVDRHFWHLVYLKASSPDAAAP